jgi:hypothetical protein
MYKEIYYCFCSSNFCNGRNITHIRGQLDCSSNTCPNGSICLDTSSGYKCLCPPWNPSCTYRTLDKKNLIYFVKTTKLNNFNQIEGQNPCNSNPCKNGGNCINIFGSCYCNCPISYTGQFCEQRDCCSSLMCLNGGQCQNQNGYCFCQCQAGFSGKLLLHKCCTFVNDAIILTFLRN